MRVVITLSCLCLLAGCGARPTLQLFPNDHRESVSSSAACTAPGDGTLTFTVLSGDVEFPQAGGGPPPAAVTATVSRPNLRARTTLIPKVTGRNRTGDIQCKYVRAGGGGGGHDAKQLVMRDSMAPTIRPLVLDDPDGDGDPLSQKVGKSFQITVVMTDRPAGGVEGKPSGLDKLRMASNPAIVTYAPPSAFYEFVGTRHGPPGGVQGNLTETQIAFATCTAPGGVTITARAIDAAQNNREESVQIECYR